MTFLIISTLFIIGAIALGFRSAQLREQRRRDEHAAAKKYLDKD